MGGSGDFRRLRLIYFIYRETCVFVASKMGQ